MIVQGRHIGSLELEVEMKRSGIVQNTFGVETAEFIRGEGKKRNQVIS